MGKYIVLFIIMGFFFACQNEVYKPKSLTKLTNQEIKERVRNGIKPNPNVVVKNQQGEMIPSDSISNIKDIENWTTDVYVNAEGLDIELILRKANADDLALREEISKILQDDVTIEQIKIEDCDNLSGILAEVLAKDQGMRNDEMEFDIATEMQNWQVVISIIEQCGMEKLMQLENNDISTIWLVIQHADLKYQKKYMPLFKEMAKNDKLDRSSIAMMEDRILMRENKPQIYGTQVIRNDTTDKWELYNLANPETVNKRRSELGFGPIEEYLLRWEILFEVEQED